jgi:hypothetical protein
MCLSVSLIPLFSLLLKGSLELAMVAYNCGPSIQEAKAGGSQVRSQPGQQRETLISKNPPFKKTKTTKQ